MDKQYSFERSAKTEALRKKVFRDILGEQCSCCGAPATEASTNILDLYLTSATPKKRSGYAKWRWIANNGLQTQYLPRCEACRNHTPYNCGCPNRGHPVNHGHRTNRPIKERLANDSTQSPQR